MEKMTDQEALRFVNEAYNKQFSKNSRRNHQYQLYRDLFDGKYEAWWPSGGNSEYGLPSRPVQERYSLTFNYFAPIALKIAAFIMADKIEFQGVPRTPSKEDRIAAQKREKIVRKIHERSKYYKILNEIALDAAILGTGWCKAFYDKDAEQTMYGYCDPECIYFEPYKSRYRGKMLYLLEAYQMNLEDARQEFGADIGIYESKIREGREADKTEAEPQVAVIAFWSKDRYILTVGNKVIENRENEYGFIPYVAWPLILQPGKILGKSIGDWIIEANGYYNQAVSQGADAQALNCNPPIIYKGAPENYRNQFREAAGGGVIPLPSTPESAIAFLTWPGQPPSVEMMLDRILTYIHDVSHIPRVAFGELTRGVDSSRVLSIQYDPIVKVMRMIRDNFVVAFGELNEMLLRLAERFEKKSVIYVGYLDDTKKRRLLKLKNQEEEVYELKGADIAGNYEVEIIWPGILPKDDLNASRFELEKHNAKVQSKWTTQENLGIRNPDDELEIMRSELSDEQLYPKEQAAALTGEARGVQALAQAAQALGGQQGAGGVAEEGAEEGAAMPGLAGGAIPERGLIPGYPGPEAGGMTAEEIENEYAQRYSE